MMIRHAFVAVVLPGLLWFCSSDAVGEVLYEENPVASMGIRHEQWGEMEAYAEALVKSKGTFGKYGVDAEFLGGVKYLEKTKRLRQKLCDRIGYPPAGMVSDGKERLERIGEDSIGIYYRCRIRFSAEMDVYGLYLVPKKAKFPAPMVIAQHGGGGFPELALFKSGSNYHDLVRGPLRHGWVVFAPHHVFYPYGDRDHGTKVPRDVRGRLDEMLRKCGTTIAAVEVAKISRALDVLLARPEVDGKRVAMTGLSYGGYYTLYTAALDPRIGVAVPSCSFVNWGKVEGDDVRKISTGGKLCDLEPWELASLICPRPLQVQAGRGDKLLTYERTVPQAKKAEEFYEGQGAADVFAFEVFDGGHEFKGELAWEFLKQFFEQKVSD